MNPSVPVAARILGIVLVGTAANTFVAVVPSMVGGLVDYGGLSSRVAGQTVTYEFAGASISTFASIFILHRSNWNLRATAFVCLLISASCNFASTFSYHEVHLLQALRFADGLGAGMSFSAAAIALVGFPHTERAYAALYGSPFLVGGVGMATFPHIFAWMGIEGGFFLLGMASVVGLLLLPLFPRRPLTDATSEVPEVEGGTASWSTGAVLVMAALFVHYICNSGIWTYFDRIGVAAGLSAQTAGLILGPSTILALAGMSAAAVLGDRWGFVRPIIAGTVAIAVSSLLLFFAQGIFLFAAGTAIFNASITFVTPYFFALLAQLVPSGRAVVVGNLVLWFGFAAGPFLLSFVVGGDDFRVAIGLTVVGFGCCLALVGLFAWLQRRELLSTTGNGSDRVDKGPRLDRKAL